MKKLILLAVISLFLSGCVDHGLYGKPQHRQHVKTHHVNSNGRYN